VPRFLLATQTFVDFARSETSPVRAWLAEAHRTRGVTDTDLSISAMSLVALERHFQDLDRKRKIDGQKIALRSRCEIFAQELRHRASIAPFGDDEMASWAQIQRLERELDLEGFVFATAIGRRLTLLAQLKPIHDQLRPLGLLVEDPYVHSPDHRP
jgi:hypothetical protein